MSLPSPAVVARDPSRSSRTASSPSGFEHLASGVQAEAYDRLASTALVYALTYLLFFSLGWISLLRDHARLCAPETVDLVRGVVAMGVAWAVWWLARHRRIPPARFLDLALVFEVFGAWGIVGDLWSWPHRVELFLETLVESGLDLDRLQALGVGLFGTSVGEHITWASIWILSFSFLVPMPRRRAILASLLATSVLPVVLVGSHLAHGVAEIAHPYLSYLYLSYLVPAYVVAAIAAYGCSITYRLSRDLTKARELGAYRLEECIGKGGMGEVWRARHRLLVRPAAVKLIRPEALADATPGGGGGDTARRRFEREAQATAALTSPHTIELYDFGVAADGTFYYVMELLDGVDLRTLVERWGPQSAARTVAILRQACHSLADAHATGLVHRDVKPANVFVCRRGLDCDFVKVLDFGLVKESSGREDAATQLTVEGITSGTPAFMAPEMATGRTDIDGRADLYALGCVAYWLLTGQLVFEEPTAMATLLAHAQDPPVPPSQRTDEIEIPPSLERLVLDLLAKRPEDRPQDALEVRRRLDAIEAEIGAWTGERAARWWETHRPPAP